MEYSKGGKKHGWIWRLWQRSGISNSTMKLGRHRSSWRVNLNLIIASFPSFKMSITSYSVRVMWGKEPLKSFWDMWLLLKYLMALSGQVNSLFKQTNIQIVCWKMIGKQSARLCSLAWNSMVSWTSMCWKWRSKLSQLSKYHQPCVNTAYEFTINLTVQNRVEFKWQGVMILGLAGVGTKEKMCMDPNKIPKSLGKKK